MRKLGSYFHVAMNGMAASDRIFRFLNEEKPKEKSEQIPEKDLNEAVILKFLKEEAREKTVLIVSHRESTMRIAEKTLAMEGGQIL